MKQPLPQMLFVEDDANDIELFKHALSKNIPGDAAIFVRDGMEALSYLAGRSPDPSAESRLPMAVVTDIRMPKIDGFTLIQTIRRSPNTRWLPVIILTTSNNPHDIRRSYELGANAYVIKPDNVGLLTETLKYVFNFWAMINEVSCGREYE